MRVRTYTEKDFARIQKFHSEAKHGFELPDPEHPCVLIRECIVDDRGVVRLAGFARLQANAYLLVDGKWKTPAERLEAIQILEYVMIEKGRVMGLDQVTAQVTPRFGKRLEDMGWSKGIGTTYSKEF